jgi:hypothetical protein
MTEQKYLLVKYSDNWADEIDVEGFHLFTAQEWEAYQAAIKEFFNSNDELCFGIGTNEEIEYSDAEEYLDTLRANYISEQQYNVLKDLFPRGFGFFPDVRGY